MTSAQRRPPAINRRRTDTVDPTRLTGRTDSEPAAQPTTELDTARWRAVLDRELRADRSFVYAVKTTGVFCRPSCSSRKPQRINVEFFAHAQGARQAGYRPCKRCEPERAQQHAQSQLISELCRYIDACREPPSVGQLASRAQLSVSHLSRVFREVTGMTAKRYIAGSRAERVRTELGQQRSVTRAMSSAGYQSNARFYDDASRQLGMTPSQYRRGAPGETIAYTIARSSLGQVLVARTARGVCAVSLGDDADALIQALGARFPHAELVSGTTGWKRVVAQVLRLVERPGIASALPLELRGTTFQRRVWDALRDIPSGSTTTYSDLARVIGAPDSARAVATACAANPLAIAIPCHRVVRKDGHLSGYRWGVERKRVLLERERTNSAPCLVEPALRPRRDSSPAGPAGRGRKGKSRDRERE